MSHARFISRWKYRFSSDQRSQATLSGVSTEVGDHSGTLRDLAFFCLKDSRLFSSTQAPKSGNPAPFFFFLLLIDGTDFSHAGPMGEIPRILTSTQRDQRGVPIGAPNALSYIRQRRGCLRRFQCARSNRPTPSLLHENDAHRNRKSVESPLKNDKVNTYRKASEHVTF